MLTIDQVLADNRRMKKFICERIAPDTTTRIVVADGGDGPLWADLLPIWDDDGECDLRIETNEPDVVGLRAMYQHFRHQEMPGWKIERELADERERWKVHRLKADRSLRESSMPPSSSPKDSTKAADKTTLTIGETAAVLGCSYGEARKRMLEGRIRAIKDGRWIRTRPEWVEEYIDKITIKPADTAGESLAIPVPSPRRRVANASVKVGGIGYRFLKKRAK